MRLSISNLALPNNTTDDALARLQQLGASGVEVAPTRIAPWDELNADKLKSYRQSLASSGLKVSSLQALLFGTEDLFLLKSDAAFDKMSDHLCGVAKIGATLGAHIGVFGSPRNRTRGSLDAQTAWSLGRDRLRHLAERVYATAEFVLGLEPVPSVYGGDFLCHWEDVVAMVQEVDHPGLRVHLDTGCVQLGGGDIGEAIRGAGALLAHFHLAEPKLGPFAAPQADHVTAARALSASQYDGWLAIEMLQQPDDPIASVCQAVEFANATYSQALHGK